MSVRNLIGKYHLPRLRRNGEYKVVVIGNCQARPLANILKALNPIISVISVVAVHLLRPHQASEFLSHFENADLIVAQLVSDEFPHEFVRTSSLEEEYGDKLIKIVNLYYRGYNPEITTVYDPASGAPLEGPLIFYHNRTIVNSWRQGSTVEKTVSRHLSEDYNARKYSQVIPASLEELKRKESNADIKVSDLIRGRQQHERLFYTFNHPGNSLMKSMCTRILERVGLESINSWRYRFMGERLNKVVVPVNIYFKSHFQTRFEDVGRYKGIMCRMKPGRKIKNPRVKYYSINELVEKFFAIYDTNLEKLPNS